MAAMAAVADTAGTPRTEGWNPSRTEDITKQTWIGHLTPGIRRTLGTTDRNIIMQTYTFARDDETFTIEAYHYDDALDGLIDHLGGTDQMHLWTYRGGE